MKDYQRVDELLLFAQAQLDQAQQGGAGEFTGSVNSVCRASFLQGALVCQYLALEAYLGEVTGGQARAKGGLDTLQFPGALVIDFRLSELQSLARQPTSWLASIQRYYSQITLGSEGEYSAPLIATSESRPRDTWRKRSPADILEWQNALKGLIKRHRDMAGEY